MNLERPYLKGNHHIKELRYYAMKCKILMFFAILATEYASLMIISTEMGVSQQNTIYSGAILEKVAVTAKLLSLSCHRKVVSLVQSYCEFTSAWLCSHESLEFSRYGW